jgi:hypothetical protein
MTREFKYRPQYSLLILGLAGLVVSFYLLPSIGLGEIGFSFLTGLFGLSSLTLTIIFLVLFARQVGSRDLKISDNQIEIPGRWTKRTILNFDQIKLIRTADTWDKVITISDGHRTHSIQGQLMDNDDLKELKIILNEKLK